MGFIAHSSTALQPEGQSLKQHLENVARRAEDCFSHPFLKNAAHLTGICHDAGKYKLPVQRHLREQNAERIDHATLGAQLAAECCGKALVPLLAAAMMGHHGGMPDYAATDSDRRSASARLQDERDPLAVEAFLHDVQPPSLKGTPPVSTREAAPMEFYLAARMLHSALVDADYLDTEQYFDPQQAALRGKRPTLASLLPLYEAHMERLCTQTDSGVHAVREEIRQSCIRAADSPQGLFSLSVPTGGGKTLSSVGFALYHALAHPNIRRVIYAIPFTSITSQNAQVFREVFGEDAVLEHHSTVPAPEEGTPSDRASENWDAPLVVSTNVQLFESIFSNKPSRSRKLHNLQDSVLILDEMQALSDDVLTPCLAALGALAQNYRMTVVICTATQPRYGAVWPQSPAVTEIMEDPDALYERMRRTYAVNLGILDDSALLERLRSHPQMLCIVNTRDHAQKLAQGLGSEKEGVYHLSTMMCADHRMKKLEEIRALLHDPGSVCQVVSTSLIEAGVDVDFPVVYREAAGLDSIAQAAGRCNRGGNRPLSPVYLFSTEGKRQPPQIHRLANITLSEIAPLYPDDMLCRQALGQYFSIRFQAGARTDKEQVYADILRFASKGEFPYASIAERFSLIQNAGEPVYIPYNEDARGLLEQLERNGPSGKLLRGLQRYSVSLYLNQLAELESRGALKLAGGLRVLDVGEQRLPDSYTDHYGLNVCAPAKAQFI